MTKLWNFMECYCPKLDIEQDDHDASKESQPQDQPKSLMGKINTIIKSKVNIPLLMGFLKLVVAIILALTESSDFTSCYKKDTDIAQSCRTPEDVGLGGNCYVFCYTGMKSEHYLGNYQKAIDVDNGHSTFTSNKYYTLNYTNYKIHDSCHNDPMGVTNCYDKWVSSCEVAITNQCVCDNWTIKNLLVILFNIAAFFVKISFFLIFHNFDYDPEQHLIDYVENYKFRDLKKYLSHPVVFLLSFPELGDTLVCWFSVLWLPGIICDSDEENESKRKALLYAIQFTILTALQANISIALKNLRSWYETKDSSKLLWTLLSLFRFDSCVLFWLISLLQLFLFPLHIAIYLVYKYMGNQQAENKQLLLRSF